MIEKIDKIAYSIRKLRVVSIATLTFSLYMTWEFIQWIMMSDPASLGEAAAVTGVVSALVALIRFVFQFAQSNESSEK